MENIIPEKSEQMPNSAQENNQSDSSPRLLKPKKTVKPLVEGINAPVSTPPATLGRTLSGNVTQPKITLTSSEKQLLQDSPQQPVFTPKPSTFGLPSQKIILQEKKSPWQKVVWSGLISLLAVSLVLGVWFWYNNKSLENENYSADLLPKRPVANLDTSGNAAVPEQAPTSTPGTSGSQPEQPSATKLVVKETPTGYLNVRNAPSTSGKLLTKIYPGESYEYVETKAGWYKITLPDGTSGWVIGTYVSK